jgi:hypothetical protein
MFFPEPFLPQFQILFLQNKNRIPKGIRFFYMVEVTGFEPGQRLFLRLQPFHRGLCPLLAAGLGPACHPRRGDPMPSTVLASVFGEDALPRTPSAAVSNPVLTK